MKNSCALFALEIPSCRYRTVFLYIRVIYRMADNHTANKKVRELTDKLERGLTELFNSESYKNYLSTMSKLHN